MDLRIVSFTLALLGLMTNALAQTTAPFIEEVLVLNGGMYGDPTQNVVVTAYNTRTGTYSHSDTIHTQSAQDMLIDGNDVFVAAQDSLVKLNLNTLGRSAAAAFPGLSTYTMLLHGNYLFLGNWYGSADSNLYVFNKADLSLNKIIGNTFTGVSGLAVLNDTLYVSQNLTSSGYTDSAGYLALVDIATLSFQGTVAGNSVDDIGKLLVHNNKLVSINSGAESYGIYDPATGAYTIGSFGGSTVSGGYLSNYQLDGDSLWAIYDDAIGAYDLSQANGSFFSTSVVDTALTAFVHDRGTGWFYATSTDYFSYKTGLIYNKAGVLQDAFEVGFSPEVIRPVYGVNNAPVAVDDADTTTEGADAMVMVLDNDTDSDGDDLLLSIVTGPANGTAMIMNNHVHYTPAAGFSGADSIEYQICDDLSASLCATAWARIAVQPASGINEWGQAVTLTMYPNPVMDELQLNVNTQQPVKATVTDLTGRAITRTQLQGSATIDARGWANGVYLVKLEGNHINLTRQVVKQ